MKKMKKIIQNGTDYKKERYHNDKEYREKIKAKSREKYAQNSF